MDCILWNLNVLHCIWERFTVKGSPRDINTFWIIDNELYLSHCKEDLWDLKASRHLDLVEWHVWKPGYCLQSKQQDSNIIRMFLEIKPSNIKYNRLKLSTQYLLSWDACCSQITMTWYCALKLFWRWILPILVKTWRQLPLKYWCGSARIHVYIFYGRSKLGSIVPK